MTATKHRRRALDRDRQRRRRERVKVYGGYVSTLRLIPRDVAELLAARFPTIAAALAADDAAELGRLLDGLEAALAYGELGSFEEDPSE